MVDLTKIVRLLAVDTKDNGGNAVWDDTLVVHIDKGSTTGTIERNGKVTTIYRPVSATPSADKPTLVWTQRYPIGTNSKFKIPVGFFTVTGGIGPHQIALSDYSKYRFTAPNEFTLRTDEGPVGAGVDTFTAYAIDGRGVKSDPITVTIHKADGDGAGLNSPNPVQSFSPVWAGRLRTDAYPLLSPGAYGPGHGDTRQDRVSVVDPKGVWASFGAGLYSPKGLPPVGEYPVTITVTNAGTGVATSFDETIVVVPPSEIVGAFFQTAVWTDTTPPGTDIGFAAATTPDNNPSFVLNTPNLIITAARRVITVSNPPVGDFVWGLTVSSGGTALSKTIQIKTTVLKGTSLSPTDMTLALNPLDNSTPGQKVGQVAVKGRTAGKYIILAQSGYNPLAAEGRWGTPARYQVDPAGLIYTPADCLLSFQDPACGWEDDQITVSWTSDDGLTTCQQAFTIPVKDTMSTTLVRVRGDLNPHASAALVNKPHPGAAYYLQLQPAGPDAYTDWTRGEDTKGGIVGPTTIELMDGVRIGGKADNTGVNSGITSYGKGHIIAANGDVRLRGTGVISGVHGSGSADGKEGFRKDGNTGGNFDLQDITIQDCDQGIETGPCHGYGYAARVKVRRCGGASVGAGLTHGFYIGSLSKFVLEDSYIDAVLYGHLLKLRARQGIIRRCTIIDSGAGACCIDLPNGGEWLLEDNLIVKGPHAANPSVINFGAETAGSPGPWAINHLTLNRNTIIAGGISYGGNYGPIFAVTHYHTPSAIPSVVDGTDNQIWLPPLGQVASDITAYAKPGTTNLTNTRILKVPPKIPFLPSLMTRPYRRRAITETAQYPNFNGVPVLVDNPFPYITAPGIVATLTPTRDIESGIDSFLAGFTSGISQDGVHDTHSNPTPWAPIDAFRMDGKGLIYNGGLAPGGYFVQPQFKTLDGGVVANHRMLATIA
jgi:hypothetical protein